MNNELDEKFMMFQRLLWKSHMRERTEGGVTFDRMRGQGRILAMLKIRDAMSVKDLAFLMGVSVPTMVELLTKLEKNGFITREQSSDDKRMTIVRLTDKGRNEKQSEGKVMSEIFSCLSEDEQKTMIGYIDRMTESLKTILDMSDEDIEKMGDMHRQMHGFMEHIREHERKIMDRGRRFGARFNRYDEE